MIWAPLTPVSGWISKRVTTGPGRISWTLALTPNSSSLLSIVPASSRSSSSLSEATLAMVSASSSIGGLLWAVAGSLRAGLALGSSPAASEGSALRAGFFSSFFGASAKAGPPASAGRRRPPLPRGLRMGGLGDPRRPVLEDPGVRPREQGRQRPQAREAGPEEVADAVAELGPREQGVQRQAHQPHADEDEAGAVEAEDVEQGLGDAEAQHAAAAPGQLLGGAVDPQGFDAAGRDQQHDQPAERAAEGHPAEPRLPEELDVEPQGVDQDDDDQVGRAPEEVYSRPWATSWPRRPP